MRETGGDTEWRAGSEWNGHLVTKKKSPQTFQNKEKQPRSNRPSDGWCLFQSRAGHVLDYGQCACSYVSQTFLHAPTTVQHVYDGANTLCFLEKGAPGNFARVSLSDWAGESRRRSQCDAHTKEEDACFMRDGADQIVFLFQAQIILKRGNRVDQSFRPSSKKTHKSVS